MIDLSRLKNLKHQAHKLCCSFMFEKIAKDKAGVAAVEFALILPIMAALYLSTVEVSMAINAQRKVAVAAGTIADLTAQSAQMDYGGVEGILRSARAIMAPYESVDMVARITFVKIVEDPPASGTYKPQVQWSFEYRGDRDDVRQCTIGIQLPSGLGTTCPATGNFLNVGNAAGEVPSALVVADSAFAMSEIYLKYDSPLGYLMTSTIPFRQVSYYRPRMGDDIPFETAAAATPWPLPSTGDTASLLSTTYNGFGVEYGGMNPNRVVIKEGTPTSGPPDLVTAYNCSVNPALPECGGGGGWSGGGGSGCAKPETAEMYNQLPEIQCYKPKSSVRIEFFSTAN